jgi:hypothetical protein
LQSTPLGAGANPACNPSKMQGFRDDFSPVF